MKMYRLKLFIVLFAAGTLFTCIDPFNPNLENFSSLLVVDALVTDENRSNYVRLSHTVETQDEEPVRVTGANVIIRDDLGGETTLPEVAEGEYRTDSLAFRGETGRTYTLNIKTSDGEEYESEPCIMYSTPDIDSLYYEKQEEISENGTETLPGIRFYIDSEEESTSSYYRWTIEEWWKFNVPEPKRYDYFNDTTILETPQIRQLCWGNKKSDEILIESAIAELPGGFSKKPLFFVASDKSNRFQIQYCVLIRQLSISQEEYEFWDHLKEISESGGNIFDKQPYAVAGNIHNTRKPTEQVLGYFQVSAVKHKRKYILRDEIIELGLPLYNYDCRRVEIGEKDFPPPLTPGPGVTFDDLIASYDNSGYIFTKPIYDNEGELERLVFVLPFCADCTLNGSMTKPDFWIDMK